MILWAARPRMGPGAPHTSRRIVGTVDGRSAPRIRDPLVAIVLTLALLGGATAQVPAAFGLTLHDPDASALNAVVWLGVGALWVWLASRAARTVDALWRLPSVLFRAGLATGSAGIVAGRLLLLLREGARPAIAVSGLEAALYELGIIALASLAAFASSRSLLRPVLAGTRPPLGARDIALRTRVLVATAGASFATAGVLLNVLIDFDATPTPTLLAFLATAAALVGACALIGWLVGEDTARGVQDVTRRIRDLAETERTARPDVPVIAADEVGDLILAANELERRIRSEEASLAATTERERIARELHDGVAKSVSVLSLEISSLAARAPGELRGPLARAEHLARTLAEELHAIVSEFRTRGETEPFSDALRRAIGAHDAATIEIDGDVERVDGLARFEVLRVLEEAVRNATRHAHPRSVTARIGVEADMLHLTVEDDGSGTGPIDWSELASQGHFGLLGMRERAGLLDGELRIEGRPGGGTRVRLDVPLNGNGA